jgi:hypothetical protein
MSHTLARRAWRPTSIIVALAACTGPSWTQAVDWTARYNHGATRGASCAASVTTPEGAHVVVDGAGNRVVALSMCSGGDYDFLTAKYAPNGRLLWRVVYDGGVRGEDTLAALSVDATGDVYVVGTSVSPNTPIAPGFTPLAFRTIKYSGSDGSVLWNVAATDRAGIAVDLALDSVGNAYVLGTAGIGTGNYDMRTIKYSRDGRQLWSVTFDGMGASIDRAAALTVDALDNVYVTGWSQSATSSDLLAHAIKYRPDGAMSWHALSNASGSRYARAIAVDEFGDVYVVVDGSTIELVKHAGVDGHVLWAAHAGASARIATSLVVDGAGGVYLAGGAATGSDLDSLVIKYEAASGNERWRVATVGMGARDERARAMAVDEHDGVYVVAAHGGALRDMRTVKYDTTNGRVLWTADYDGTSHGVDIPYGLALNAAGTLDVLGLSRTSNGVEATTLTYRRADGALLALDRDAATSGTQDRPVADERLLAGVQPFARPVGVDAAGSTYVAGATTDSDGESGITIKYRPDGSVAWRQVSASHWSGIAVDPNGNAHVAGWTVPDAQWQVAKYDSDGNVAWTLAAAQQGDRAHALALDDAGGVYVTGVRQQGPSTVCLTSKYTSMGTPLWSSTYGAPKCKALAVAPGPLGTVFVLGTVDPVDGPAVIVKYAADGRAEWVASTQYHGPFVGLVVDRAGNAFEAGPVWNGHDYDHRVVKHASADGHVLWDVTLDGSGGRNDQPTALALDNTGDLYVAGYSYGPGQSDYRSSTMKLAGETGEHIWRVNELTPVGTRHAPQAVGVDASGAVWVTGYLDSGRGRDYRTRRYSGYDGTLTWSRGYASAGGGHDSPHGIALDAAGNVHVTGTSVGSSTGEDFLTIKYVPAAPPTADVSVSIGNGLSVVAPGADTTYVIEADNRGPVDLAAARVEARFPTQCASVTWSCAPSPGAACSPTGSGNIADNVQLPVGGHVTYSARCAVASTATGRLIASAAASGPLEDHEPTNNMAGDDDELRASTDLAVSFMDLADPIPPYGVLTYSATYGNAGPSHATDATLVVSLPPGVTFVSALPAAPICEPAGSDVLCRIGTVAASTGGTVQVRASANPGTVGVVTAGVRIEAPATDVDPRNNSAAESTLVKFQKGDLQNDLATDLFLSNTVTGEQHVWLMNAVTRLTDAPLNPVTPSSLDQQIVGVDDFNGDLRNDLVLWNRATGAVEFWPMNGTTRLGPPLALSNAPTLPPNWKLCATADFNHDARPDLLWRNTSSQRLVVWTMNGTAKTGAIIPNPDQAADGNWEVVAASDLDGDSNVDLLWQNTTSGKIAYWLMNASMHRIAGSFTNPASAGDNNWRVLAAGDYGPGSGGIAETTDLVWRNTDSGRLAVWHMDWAGNRTSGSFTTPMQPDTSALDWTVVGPR